ncbi:hypothetical protein SKAU_G00182840 [Synaphobranchus kaupii]|uniref:Uncharacterized protein n=1 Tax=Synaphobranchus kaupii TaxID=118154 RepID=A0A9Q1FCG7_SYNKA|nr:hypothetical protein SKAU_G00182840 [Synaphobranchus kaupii]
MGYSCQNVHTVSQNKDFPVRNGRAGKGSSKLPQSPKSRVASLQNSVKEGTFNFLSSIEYSRSELQLRPSRIPVSRAGSLAEDRLARSVSVAECASVREWKFVKPGISRKLSLSGPTLLPTSMALLKNMGKSSPYLVSSDTEAQNTVPLQENPAVGNLLSEPISVCRKVPLCGEA